MLIPGTVRWLLGSLDLRAQFAVRTELRRLERDADARLAVLAAFDGGVPHVVDYAGDVGVTPTPMSVPALTIPTTDARPCADGEMHQVAEHRVRLGRGMPLLTLAVVEPGVRGPEVFDALENIGARIEGVLVKRLDRA